MGSRGESDRTNKQEVMRVLVIDEDPARAAILEQALADAGGYAVTCLHDSSALYQRVRSIDPDVIIIDMDSPDRDTLESMRQLHLDQPRPVVMFTDEDDSGAIRRAVDAGVSAYVVDGLHARSVTPVLEVAVARFREFQAMQRELTKARNDLAERKLIDQAKGLIMRQRGIDEAEAYRLLRATAMERNRRIGEIAAELIEAAKLLG